MGCSNFKTFSKAVIHSNRSKKMIEKSDNKAIFWKNEVLRAKQTRREFSDNSYVYIPQLHSRLFWLQSFLMAEDRYQVMHQSVRKNRNGKVMSALLQGWSPELSKFSKEPFAPNNDLIFFKTIVMCKLVIFPDCGGSVVFNWSQKLSRMSKETLKRYQNWWKFDVHLPQWICL